MIKATFSWKISKEKNLQNGWFAINHNWIKMEKRRRFHGKWFKLKSEYGTSFRILKFDPHLKKYDEKKGQIDIDWQAWIKLFGFFNTTPKLLQLEIRKVRFWEYPFVGFTHPDPTVRLNCFLAALSIILGIVGIVK